MPSQLTQHNIESYGDLLDLIRKGNKASLESIDFKITVGSTGEGAVKRFHLAVGHPKTSRERREGFHPLPPRDTAEFAAGLARLGGIKQLVLDIRAQAKNSQFTSGELEYVYQELPRFIAEYRKQSAQNPIQSEIVISTDCNEIYEAMRDGTVHFGEGVVGRCYVANTAGDPFETAIQLGTAQICLGFPTGENSGEELQRLRALSKTQEYQHLKVTVFVRNNPQHAELVQRHFPEASIITNITSTIEQEQKQKRSEASTVR